MARVFVLARQPTSRGRGVAVFFSRSETAKQVTVHDIVLEAVHNVSSRATQHAAARCSFKKIMSKRKHRVLHVVSKAARTAALRTRRPACGRPCAAGR
jgi:hypothetical protein